MYLSIYILYICFSTKNKFTLYMSKYILLYNHHNNCVHSQPKDFIYQEDDGREQSMNYAQEVCNNMLDVTAVLYMYVCMHASACGCVNTYPIAPPSDINAHTQRK